MVRGQFGLVEAYQGRKAEIKAWLSDHCDRVSLFAEKHIRDLDRQIAANQRRSMEEHELRKREYENLEEEQTDDAPPEDTDGH